MSTEQAAELPPLPEPGTYGAYIEQEGAWEFVGVELRDMVRQEMGADYVDEWFSADQMRAYAEQHAAALRAELEKAREDARRYRWLRDSCNSDYCDSPICFSYNDGVRSYLFIGPRTDEVIDAAMSTDQAERKV